MVSTSVSESGVYSNTQLQITTGINPAGMDMRVSCCMAHNFATDDSLAIDYNEICNSASTSASSLLFSTVLGMILSTVLVLNI
jgi:hypothetical protein